MILTLEISLVLAGLLALGVWGLVSGVRAGRHEVAELRDVSLDLFSGYPVFGGDT